MAEGTSNDTAKSKNVKVPVSGGNQGNLLKPKQQGNAFNSQQNKQTSGNARGKKNGGRKNNKKKV